MATALKLRTDIKKLKDALKVKKIPANIKSKLESQLKKSQDELAALKKGKKTPTSRSAVKGTQTALSRLKSLIKKPKYGVYADGQTKDLEEDAVQGAFPKGRRVSKGLKSNQFGSAKENKGKVYYEYRSNRLDVKQPKKRQTYPKLEKGGYMADGGSVKKKIIADGGKLNNKYILSFNYNPSNISNADAERIVTKYTKNWKHDNDFDEVSFYVFNLTKEDADMLSKELKMEDVYNIELDYSRYADGGMMADGGEIVTFQNAGREYYDKTKKEWAKEPLTFKKGQLVIYEHSDGAKVEAKLLGKSGDKAKIEILDKYAPFTRRVNADYINNWGRTVPSNYKQEVPRGTIKTVSLDKIEIADEKYYKRYIKPISQMLRSPEFKEEFSYLDDKMADGGMMAKGGKLSLSEFAERYDDNEDNNMHSENVVLLAENFGTKQDILDAKTILAKHEAIGSLPYYLMQERDALSNRLYAKYQEAAKKKESDGGMMADGGVVYTYEKIKNYPTFDTEEEAKKFIKLGKPFLRKQLRDGEIVLVHNGKEYFLANVNQKKKMADGGMMAKGAELGGFKKGDKVVLKYDINNRQGSEEVLVVVGFDDQKLVLNTTTPKIGKSKNMQMLSYVYPNDVVSYDNFISGKYAHGGEIEKGDMVKVDNPYWHAAMGTDKPVVRKVTMVAGEDVFFKDGSTSSMKYVTKMEAGGVMAEA